jgi:succinate-semialdehyde dehydrogenase/glutarate-semialdehyde dehydrogenase
MTIAPPEAPDIEVRNPVSDEVVGRVSVAMPADVAQAVEDARVAQPAWSELGFGRRAEVVRRFVALLEARQSEVLDTLQDETGKTRRDAFTELLTVVGTARYYATHGRRFLADRRGSGAVPGIVRARSVAKPCGVVGFVTPWNYPLLLGMGDMLPALLAGNSVVIKPSEVTPLSAEKGLEILRAAGLPEAVVSLVHGPGEVGADLVSKVDFVAFTGSTATGRRIAVAAAERLIPYSLELGGKNPMVVLDGAPIEQAVEGFVAGAFFNAGQTCIAVERVFVEEPVYDEFVRRAVERVGRLELGWSHGWEFDMGCLISRDHTSKVLRHIEDAVSQGAEPVSGGRLREDLGPTFVEPTLLLGVDESALLHDQETFGPVVALHCVANAQEAIDRANDTPYGLNASVWGPDGAGSVEIARRLETGSAVVNGALTIYHCFGVPMGGVKQSGIGRRHAEQGIRRFTQTQSIVTGPPTAGGYDNVLSRVRSDRGSRIVSRLFQLRSKIPGLR